MTVARNIVTNYASQLYASAIAILMVPMYVRYMGVEAYGLVGFYAVLQGWFLMLDMGLSATLSREAARYNAGAVEGLELRRLVRSFEGIFLTVALVGAIGLTAASQLLASRWLRVEQLSLGEVQSAIALMAVIVALRWISGLYRGIVMGMERIVWLSGLNTGVATFRFLLVVPYLIFIGSTPTHFFAYQLVIACCETWLLVAKTYRLMPTVARRDWIRWEFQPLRGVAAFTLSVAFTSAVWVIVTQGDKLLLSGMIPLGDYALYTMAVLLAGGVIMLSGPVTSAILPRLTRLHAEGDEVALRSLYRLATQIVGVIIVPVVLVLAFFPVAVVTAWTGQPEIAVKAAPVLCLYAIGNGVLAFASFSYLIQVARGNLTLHLIGNLMFVAVFIPLLVIAVGRFGMVGAGWAWLLANLLPFVLWLPVVHHRYLRGLHAGWLLRDVAAPVVPATVLAFLLAQVVAFEDGRFVILAQLGGVYALLALTAALCSSEFVSILKARTLARAA